MPHIGVRAAESISAPTDANGQFTIADVTNGQHFVVTGVIAAVNTSPEEHDVVVTAKGTVPPSRFGWVFTVYELKPIAGGNFALKPIANTQVVIMWAAFGVTVPPGPRGDTARGWQDRAS